MKEKSIFSYWWFWLLIIGIVLILVAAFLHLGFKENTKWVWWIFAAGALLAVLGVIFAFISYFNEPTCRVISVSSKCEKIVPSSYNNVVSDIGVSQTTLNLPQAKRGFTTSGVDLSVLAPK